MNAPAYVCPMHADARSSQPGQCPHCRMPLVQEGAKFAILRHMLASPLHVAIMVVVMLALLAVAVMLR